MKLIPGLDEIVIAGIVTPCQWDIGNKVVSVAIVTEKNEEFQIANPVTVQQLLPHLEKPVESVGIVSKATGTDPVNMFNMRVYRALPDDYLLDPDESEWKELEEVDELHNKRRQRHDVEDIPRHGRQHKKNKLKTKKRIREKDLLE